MTTKDTLKSKREEANKLVEEIQKLNLETKKIKESAESLYDSVEKKDVNYKKLISSLDRINSTTNDAIVQFRKERDKVKTLLTQANSFYNKKYLPLVEKIENKESGFRAKISQSGKLLTELGKVKLDCAKQYDEIKKFVSEYKKKYAELKTIDRSIRSLHESSQKNNSKSEVLLTNIQRIEKEVILSKENVKNIEKVSEKLGVSIEDIEKNSKSLLNKINTFHKDSNEKLKSIQDIYQIAHETGLSGEFENRRNNLKLDIKKWEKRIFWSSLVLFAGIVGLFVCQLALYDWNITTKNFDYNFYVRFLILSPVVYYLVFCSSQYGLAKKLHDKYSFKTTLAMSIKSHIDLLTNDLTFSDDKYLDKILDFILSGFERIYTEPYAEDDYKMKIRLANLEIDLRKEILDKLNLKDKNIISK